MTCDGAPCRPRPETRLPARLADTKLSGVLAKRQKLEATRALDALLMVIDAVELACVTHKH